ncbi:MAG: hypothetical protein MI784_11225 [Cytophagales bacterium]|nr:hypothetical protein [Cytophagales bacterium]
MKRNNWFIRIVFFSFFFLYSCSNTQLLTSWENAKFKGETYNSYAVVAVLGKRLNSDAFVQGVLEDFSQKGVEAINGNSFIASGKKYNKDTFNEDLKKSGTEAYMFFKLLGLKKNKTYTPPTSYLVPSAGGYWGSPFYGYYFPQPFAFYYWYPAYQVINTPGYWSVSKVYQIEVAVYSAKDDQLVYTARTDTFDPTGSLVLGESIGKVLLRDMKAKGLVDLKRK